MRFCSRRTGQFFISAFRKPQFTKPPINDLTRVCPAVCISFTTSAKYTSNYSDDRKTTLLDNILKVVTKAETFNNTPEVPSSSSRRLSQRQPIWKSNQRVHQLLPHLFAEDGNALPTVSMEQQLRGLMQIWELEEAVRVLETSVKNGAEPHSAIILDLLQQLANMGEIGCLLDVYEILKERGLTTNLRFYHCLRDAYFNSGRIEEGVTMLRLIYHSTRDFKNADMFFTLLTIMIIKHFAHHLPLVESFICDLEESDPPVLSARALLWRCFVLAEKFKAADDLLAAHDHLKKMVPEQVTKIVQSSFELDYNKSIVLQWLLHLSWLKAGLKASVLDMLIQHKSLEGDWLQVLDLLSTAMDQGTKIQKQTVQVFLTRFLSQLSPEQVQQLSDWADKLEKLPSDSDS